MGLFDNSKKEEQRQFKEQLQRQDESNEAQQSMQMAERGAVAFEPQVSAMLLKNGSKLLKWKEDFDNNILIIIITYRPVPFIFIKNITNF